MSELKESILKDLSAMLAYLINNEAIPENKRARFALALAGVIAYLAGPNGPKDKDE